MLFASLIVVTVAVAAATTVRGACDAEDLATLRAKVAELNADCTCGDGQEERTHEFTVKRFSPSAAVQAFCPAADEGSGGRKRSLLAVDETEACRTLRESLAAKQNEAKTANRALTDARRPATAAGARTAAKEAADAAKAALETFQTTNADEIAACKAAVETAARAAAADVRAAVETRAANLREAAEAALPKLQEEKEQLRADAELARSQCTAAEDGAERTAACDEAITAVKAQAKATRDELLAARVSLREANAAERAATQAKVSALVTEAKAARAELKQQLREKLDACTEDNTCGAKLADFKTQFADALRESEVVDELQVQLCAKASVNANKPCLHRAQQARALLDASVGATRARAVCIKLEETSEDADGNIAATVTSCRVAAKAVTDATEGRKRDAAADDATVQSQLTSAGFELDTATGATIDGENTSAATTSALATATLALAAAAVAALL